MNKAILLFALACPLLAQDARQIVQEAQRRGRSISQRYEGVLEVTSAPPDTAIAPPAIKTISPA